MGFDLYNEHDDYFRWTASGWAPTLEIALYHGWEPLGTHSPWIPDELIDGQALPADEAMGPTEGPNHDTPTDFEWDGTYASNSGQIVSTEDAANLAEALRRAANVLELRREFLRERGLLDESDPLGLDDRPRVLEVAGALNENAENSQRTNVEAYLAMLDEDLSNRRIERLREFAEFCSRGSFRIF